MGNAHHFDVLPVKFGVYLIILIHDLRVQELMVWGYNSEDHSDV